MFVIAFVGFVSLTSGEFPPTLKSLKAGVERLRKSYASIATMQELLPQLKNQMAGANPTVSDPTAAQSEATPGADSANPMSALQTMMASQQGGKLGSEAAAPDMAASMALVQGMMQQMAASQAGGGRAPTSVTIDPELMKQLTKIEQQNNELLQRLSRIQTYLTGLHQYLAQLKQPVQGSQVPQAAHAVPGQQRSPTSVSPRPRQ